MALGRAQRDVKICQAVHSVATRRLSLLFDWRPRGSDEGELIRAVSCSCRQQLSRLMEVRRGQQASWQRGTEGLNNITPRWGRVGMKEQKDGGTDLLLSQAVTFSSPPPTTTTASVFTQSLNISRYSRDHMRMTYAAKCGPDAKGCPVV